jgi:hypothetical protein
MELWRDTQVASINDNRPVRMTVSGLNNEELWLTGLRGSVEPNFQLMYSFGNSAFINAFNQRLSQFQISGIFVAATCDGGQRSEPAFVDFYKKRNIVSSEDPTKITFDGITITGWFTSMNIGDVTNEGIQGHLFTLGFLGRLRKAGDNADGGGEELGINTVDGTFSSISSSLSSGAAGVASAIGAGSVRSARLRG